jgi:O6-methylguanine-DNA--protein-cysteine methyltransferase
VYRKGGRKQQKILDKIPISHMLLSMQLYQIFISSPLGDLIAIATDDHLVMLEFTDSRELTEKLARFPDTKIETNMILNQTILQLSEYFE